MAALEAENDPQSGGNRAQGGARTLRAIRGVTLWAILWPKSGLPRVVLGHPLVPKMGYSSSRPQNGALDPLVVVALASTASACAGQLRQYRDSERGAGKDQPCVSYVFCNTPLQFCFKIKLSISGNIAELYKCIIMEVRSFLKDFFIFFIYLLNKFLN